MWVVKAYGRRNHCSVQGDVESCHKFFGHQIVIIKNENRGFKEIGLVPYYDSDWASRMKQ
jgi:hypothetical protein